MTKGKGRGVFATKNLKKGNLLIVDKAIVEAISDNYIQIFVL